MPGTTSKRRTNHGELRYRPLLRTRPSAPTPSTAESLLASASVWVVVTVAGFGGPAGPKQHGSSRRRSLRVPSADLLLLCWRGWQLGLEAPLQQGLGLALDQCRRPARRSPGRDASPNMDAPACRRQTSCSKVGHVRPARPHAGGCRVAGQDPRSRAQHPCGAGFPSRPPGSAAELGPGAPRQPRPTSRPSWKRAHDAGSRVPDGGGAPYDLAAAHRLRALR